jgi:hypothetical protein
MVMNQHIISRVAIYILAIVMIVFGIQHFLHPYDLLVKVPDFLPGGIVWVYLVGTAFIFSCTFLYDQHMGKDGSLPFGFDAFRFRSYYSFAQLHGHRRQSVSANGPLQFAEGFGPGCFCSVYSQQRQAPAHPGGR